MPTQRGTATTTNSFGSATVAAPTGLATGDSVIIAIRSEGADPNWTLTGFTNVFETGASSQWLTILAGTIAGSPPSGFTPTAGTAPSYWEMACVAYDDADLASLVLGTAYAANPFGANVVITGITVPTSSTVLTISTEQFGGLASPSGWTTVLGSTQNRIYSNTYSGATGSVTQAPGNGFQIVIAVLVGVPEPAASTVTGTVARTLGNFTSTATGGTGPSGTVARTLANVTSTASGSSVRGTLTRTLAAFTSSATGSHGVAGTIARTLAAFTSAASGNATPPLVTGTVARTLAPFTSSASGTATPPLVTGTSATTLGAFVSAASGTANPPGISGAVAATLAPFTSTATGTATPPTVTGTAAVTLATFTSSASGTANPPGVSGSVAQTLAPFTATATGSTVVGTSSTTIATFTASGSGAHGVNGTLSRTLAPFTATASGAVFVTVTGTLAETLANFTCTAYGSFGDLRDPFPDRGTIPNTTPTARIRNTVDTGNIPTPARTLIRR